MECWQSAVNVYLSLDWRIRLGLDLGLWWGLVVGYLELLFMVDLVVALVYW